MADPGAKPVLAFLVLLIGCGALIAATATLTRERIETNRAERFLATLTELTGSAALAAAVQWDGDTALLCPPAADDAPGEADRHAVRALLRGDAAGYAGPIRWLAAAELHPPAPVLSRLRVTEHQETPGIVDFLGRPEQGWLASLLDRNAAELTAVDAVSGATITSRALTRSLATALGRQLLLAPECPR